MFLNVSIIAMWNMQMNHCNKYPLFNHLHQYNFINLIKSTDLIGALCSSVTIRQLYVFS